MESFPYTYAKIFNCGEFRTKHLLLIGTMHESLHFHEIYYVGDTPKLAVTNKPLKRIESLF